jgi:hypothetical protein
MRCPVVQRISVLLVAALPALVAGQAAAQPRDTAAAEELFREARALVTRGDYPGACAKFAESQRLDPATGTLFNLADCEEHLGRTATAWGDFVAVAEDLAPTDERYAYAREHAAALEPTLPRLAIVVSGKAPASTAVTRDGVAVGPPSLGVALPVDPGSHVIVASAPGRTSRVVRVDLRSGRTLRVEVAPEDPPADVRRTLGYVLVGVGAAGLAVGSYFGVRALARQSDGEADCAGSVCRDPSGLAAHQDALAFARAADVGLAVGLAGVCAGGVLLFASRTRVAPTVGRSGGGVTVGLAW